MLWSSSLDTRRDISSVILVYNLILNRFDSWEGSICYYYY